MKSYIPLSNVDDTTEDFSTDLGRFHTFHQQQAPQFDQQANFQRVNPSTTYTFHLAQQLQNGQMVPQLLSPSKQTQYAMMTDENAHQQSYSFHNVSMHASDANSHQGMIKFNYFL
jgi:hypothetical protein